MTKYLISFLDNMKPAFSYSSTFAWFVIAFSGLIMRYDSFGVTSIVRALMLPAGSYYNLLHFFRSTAWSAESLLRCWMRWVQKENMAATINGRIVLIGDHTKAPKDGRKIPALTSLHQDSESASKPSFFRGHEWGGIALLIAKGSKLFANPMKIEIHNDSVQKGSRITRLIEMAVNTAAFMNRDAYLVLDAFFSVGTTFEVIKNSEARIHVLTRAKKNIVAYIPAETPLEKKVGRPRVYGEKLKLMKLYDEWTGLFITKRMKIYGKVEPVKYLSLDLMWKPTKGLIRFFLFETSRGRIILMTSDLNMPPAVAMELYCHRITIETMFDVLKNTLNGLKYHFWSKYLIPASRRPIGGKQVVPKTTNPDKTKATLEAIEKFVTIQIVVLGFLQLLALKFPEKVYKKAMCWLRTNTSKTPSEFVTKIAVANMIRSNLSNFDENLITHFIRNKQKTPGNTGLLRKVG